MAASLGTLGYSMTSVVWRARN